MRLIFASIIVFHGLLHLIGFAREWDLGRYRPLSGKIRVDLPTGSSRVAGSLWLIAAALFVVAAILYVLKNGSFWMPAAAALVLSQTLIAIYWQDARYGSAMNAVILVVVLMGVVTARFDNAVKRDVDLLHAQGAGESRMVTNAMIAGLPAPVRRWLHRSGAVGKVHPNTFRIEQQGSLRTKPGSRWMPFRAVQVFSIDPPAFVWQAHVQMAPLLTIAARDTYLEGQGQMLVKPLYLFTAANSSGPEINQGSLVRYMAEMMWFPHAATSPYVRWEALNSNQARITMEYAGTAASGVYSFDELGNVKAFEAPRYGEFEGQFRKELWHVSTTVYKEIGGQTIGTASELTWKLPEGDFTWLRVEVTDIRESENR